MQSSVDNRHEALVKKLDLTDHIASLQSFYSREKSLFMEGDQQLHYSHIKALEKLEFTPPPKVANFKKILAHIKRSGLLRFDQIFELIKVVRYFKMMNSKGYEGIIGEWMSKFDMPDKFMDIAKFFDEKGQFIVELDEQIHKNSLRLKERKNELNAQLSRLLSSQKLHAYLVDSSVHYQNDYECLLMRSGFNHVLKGSVVGRSSGGFFYITPDVILKIRERIKTLLMHQDELLYEYAKRFSNTLYTLQSFIRYIDKEFDRFDNYSARVLFARATSSHIIKTNNSNNINIYNFAHPSLNNPKLLSVEWSKPLLLITGVNAGGKTILLKSLLSAAFMAKYLIPMRLDPHRSTIGNFKKIFSIIDDPQNVKNDISTFAGRMREFSTLLQAKETLVGVDEIELGTDSDEAAALFKVILDQLINKKQKIVVTTHHKRLASLMADNDKVELIAAMYDEENRVPTYEFLQGTIGRSYAFETALRYGIPPHIIKESKSLYSEQLEQLNLLIERSSQLQRELRDKHKDLDDRLQKVHSLQLQLKEQKLSQIREHKERISLMKQEFQDAIKSAKDAAKAGDTASIHRALNVANSKIPKPTKPAEDPIYLFKVGDSVKYRKHRATITHIGSKEITITTDDSFKIRVDIKDLKPTAPLPLQKPKVEISTTIHKRSALKLDLHGLRADEAIEQLDQFISDALINGWDETLIYHGIGEGKLSYVVKQFLKEHPKVLKFEDAPPQLGGFGAKVVWL